MLQNDGRRTLLAAASDGNGGQGAAIFHAKAFAKALPLLSHR